MMLTKKGILFNLILLTSIFSVYSQEHRYFVFLSDKTSTPYSINIPDKFLSARSLARRARQNIEITEQDLPVDPDYLNQIDQTGAETYYTSRWLNGVIVQMDSLELEMVQAMSFVDSIAWIGKGARLSPERNQVQIPNNFSNPPSISSSSELQLGMLNVDDMHDDGYTGTGIIIAVLDGGFLGAHLYKPMEHIFKNGNYLGGEDMVTYGGNPFQYAGHGTAVWSIIGSKNDSLMGAAFDAGFLLFVTEDIESESPIEEYNWLIAAEKADSAGADIIQSSLGYSVFNAPYKDYSYEDMDGETAIVTQAANYAFNRGMLVVTSAGNEGSSSWRYITAPADSPNVLAVGSIGTPNSHYDKTDFSSIGPSFDGRIKPDVVAKGYRTSLMAGNGYIQNSSGTSYAAPLISGFAAGIWQAHPDWTNKELLDAIRNSGSRALNPDNYYGYGIPNYLVAVLGSVLDVTDILSEKVKVFPNPFQDEKVHIDLSNLALSEDLIIRVYDLKGSIINTQVIPVQTKGIVDVDILSNTKGIYLMTLTTSQFFKEIKLIKN